ncbi:DinB family protein [Mucilaginibacter yixingensis]|uniref:DinB family protein n=1 Tax=Mucilaginibacter yixingensis TaxID=1295612 RepID=A0A2T5J5I2_9SPHI|nr:putative metal-dependent hydrolase [Mucilaginibacter yixingensis]PTQ93243.1 DinB family protein [Mucilaginibacter yixingensis]
MLTDEQMRYPIGKFETPQTYTPQLIKEWIDVLRNLPAQMRAATARLTDAQLNTPYRKEGWTLRQVVHHVPDSHLSAMLRFKWALTEDNPTIKPYNETAFAQLPEYSLDIEPSLALLESLHGKLVILLENLTESDLERTYYHPESKTTAPLKQVIAMYAWHSRHHLAHITETVKKFA